MGHTNVTELGYLVVGDMDTNANSLGTMTVRDDYILAIDNGNNVVLVPTGKPRKTQVQNSVDVSGQT